MSYPIRSFLFLSVALSLSANLTICEANGNLTGNFESAHLPRRGLWSGHARIVGGEVAPSGTFPYFVELSNGCGGSLIHNDLVITAAHCVNGDRNMALLRASPNVFIGGTKTQHGRADRKVVDALVDPRYDPSTASYDFAILLLDKPVEIATPLIINTKALYPVDQTPLTVIGYGYTTEGGGKRSPTLQQASVNYRADCTGPYEPGKVKNYEMMCAHAPDYSRDACQGDSGGPLISADNVLVGIVSWGEGCAKWDAPGVYARVSAASEWISQQKCELSNVPPADCICTRRSRDCAPIQVDISYDMYPYETGWLLKRQTDGGVIASSPVGSITSPSLQTISYPILVTSGTYQLEIEDSYGDGICCGFGMGSIAVYDGVTEVLYTGEFGASKVVSFDAVVPGDPTIRGGGSHSAKAPAASLSTSAPTATPSTTAPTSSPTLPPRVSLRLEIVYDYYPEETSWSLIDDVSGAELANSPSYSIMTPMQLVATTIPDLLAGQFYTLTVKDIAHDGLCCMYGQGLLQIWLVASSGEEELIWFHRGDFGAELKASIMVPLSP